MDASSIAKKPTELVWIFAPEVQQGAFAPPIAKSLASTAVGKNRLTLTNNNQILRNPWESLGFPWNPEESVGIHRNPQESNGILRNP